MSKFSYHQFSLRFLLAIIVFLSSILMLLIRISRPPQQLLQAAWYDDRYTYRQLLSFTHNANLTFQSVGITISTSGLVSAGKMQSNCNDVRFTDPSGDVLPYSYTSGCNTTTTYFNVGFNSIKNGTNYAYVYYGNPTALSASQSLTNYTTLVPSGGNPTAATEEAGGGPIAYWKMDEGVGSTANDSSGQNIKGNFGTGSSAPTWQANSSCKFGNCLSFSGNQYLAGSSAIMSNTNNFTMEAWVYPTDLVTSNQIFFYNGHDSGGYGMVINGNGTSNGSLQAIYGAIRWIDSGYRFPSANRWYHVVMLRDSGTLKFYVNGIQTSTTDNAGGPNTPASYFTIGCEYSQFLARQRFFTGRLDDLKAFNYVRSIAQILSDLNSNNTSHGSVANLGVASTETGPVGYWNFEEGVGTTAYDSSTNNNSAELKNSPSWSPGKYGTAMSLNGSSQYLEAVHSSSLNITGNITLESWVKFNSLASNSWILEKNGDSNQKAYYTWWSNSGYLDVGYHDGTNYRDYTYTWTPNLNTWYHVAWTADGTNVNIYINGVLVKQTTQTGAVKSNSVGVLDFGRSTTGGGNFAGSLDEVKVYNYARTQKQVIQDMNAGHPAGGSPVGSQLGYWKFDEGVGITANNSGSLGSTLNANLQTGTSSPTWTTNGLSNKALSFDGNDYLTVPETGDLRFPTTAENFTLSAWVKRSSIGTTQYILSKEDSDNDGWRLLFDGANTITCSIGATDVTSTLTVTDTTTWHHVACAMNRTGTGQVYLDGKPASPATSIAGQVLATTTALTIGGRSYTPTHFFNGSIDEVKIYSSQLTANEILLDYNLGQALVLGSASSDVGGTSYSNSSSQSYCVPGDSSTCSPPIAQWLFEEGVGTTAYDTSGNTRPAVFATGSSAPSWSPADRGGKALSFGGNNYLTITDGVNPTAYTIEAWVKAYGTGETTTNQGIFVRTAGDPAGSWSHQIRITSVGKFESYTFDGGAKYVIGSTPATTNTWFHIVGVAKNNDFLRLYVNGKEDGAPVAIGTLWTGGSSYQIGSKSGNGINYFNGIIDDVRLYNYARTPAQIAWDYNQGKPARQWKMDECQGGYLFDSSGVGTSASITIAGTGSQTALGICSAGTGSSAWYSGRNGKINSSLNFDGTDDFAATAAFSPLASTGQTAPSFSWGGWFYPTTSAASKTLLEKASEFQLTTDANSMPICGIYYSAAFHNSAAPTTALTLSAWNHVLCTYDGTNINTYLNGNLIKQSAETNKVTTASSILYFAKTSGGANFYSGQQDDIRLYNYALTSTQVKTLYNSGTAINFAPISGTP